MNEDERNQIVADLRQLNEWCGGNLAAELLEAEEESEMWYPPRDTMAKALLVATAASPVEVGERYHLSQADADGYLRAAWADLGYIYRLLLQAQALPQIVVARDPLAWPYPFTLVGVLAVRPSHLRLNEQGHLYTDTSHPHWRTFCSLEQVVSSVTLCREDCEEQVRQLVAGLYADERDAEVAARFVLRP